MKINKVFISVLVLTSASLTACSSDDTSGSQSATSPDSENQELYDATKHPLDQARAVEKTVMDKAAQDRKAMDGDEHDAHH